MERKPVAFEFTSYQYEPGAKRTVFHYATKFSNGDVMPWAETILLPKIVRCPTPHKLLEALHIILAISYWKFHCAPKIALPYKLTKQEAEFWNTVYKKGLGEFFYKNNLDPSISPKFPTTQNVKRVAQNVKSYTLHATQKYLVGIGGGKDSIVSAELLKEAEHDITSFHIEFNRPSELVDNVMNIIGAPQLKIRRVLDEKVHQKHPYNGHIPISAIYAFLGVLSAILYGYKGFIVSNEYSSNFGNVMYKGLEVNHQWSKSFEFEQLFQNYVRDFISPDIHYFSLLRPFYEIRIAKMFAKMSQYFKHFSSCNRNFVAKGATHKRLWCGQCAKCVFTWVILSASLSKKELINIFGKDLSQEENLQPLFKDILGQGNMKPFDCVGTFEEAQEALATAEAGSRPGGRKHPEVWQTQKENTVPDEFKFLGAESAYILGYGKEGKITKQYLNKFYPKLKIGVGDATLDKNYLAKQKSYDTAIKTPGIKKELITIPYTTATNIFFSKVKNKHTIIGVTGSKGKSTTSSLIYHMLKTAGKRVELLGNISKPMVERLLKPIPKSTIFVLELSSYQLDDIHYSPDIAVVTNLFPEHMDFHGSLEKYYAAKKNIFKHQSKNDHLVFCVKAKRKYETNLLGQHNQNNIETAVQVAKILEIPATKIKRAVESFKGLPHRLEKVGEYGGITFYDDAISTAPESTIMAIKALKHVDTIFLGGQDRGYNFSQLEKVIRQYNIKNIVLFPDSGKKIIRNTNRLNILRSDSMKEAVKFAYHHTKKGRICLLSCASPSYSLWKNFEEKGEQFKFFVKKLSNESPH